MKTMKTIPGIAAFIVALFFAAFPAAAQFAAEQALTAHGAGSISFDPYVYAKGTNVYVVWSEFNGGAGHSDIWIRVSTNNGTSFGAAVNVSNSAGNKYNPIVAGDGTNVYVFWTDDLAGDNPLGANSHLGSIFYARSGNNGLTFTTSTLVDQAGYSRPTSVELDGSNRPHLVFYDNRIFTGASIAGRVYHKMSCDSGVTWTNETQVTQFDGDVDTEHPRLTFVQSSGDMYLTFRSSRDGLPQPGHPPFQIYLLRMNLGATGCPGGAQWFYPAQRVSKGSQVDMAGNYGQNAFPGAAGGLHMAWWNDNAGTNLVYRYGKPNGAGFGAQQDLSQFGVNHLQWTGVSEVTGMGMGEDATGQVHAAFLQNENTRGNFQVGRLWYRCAPAPTGSAFVAKRLATIGLATEPRAAYNGNRFHMVWQDFRGTSNDQSEIYYNNVDTTVACTAPVVVPPPAASTSLVDFGANSMLTTSTPQTFQLTNTGAGSMTINGISASASFSVVGTDCATLAAGASCNVTVSFTPQTVGTVPGSVSITYSGSNFMTVNLTGVSERSLVIHYYRSILNRTPDAAGKAFWDGEATRMASLGADLREAYFVMANYFFNSPEYASFGKNDTQFVTDLYNTFFNRPPDAGGLGFWVSQIQGGLPREVVLFSFMFSNEFQTFTTAIFGNVNARPEINLVMDFFRGILNRLPDTTAFNFWVGQLKTAQCQGPGAVYDAVNGMSYQFIFGAEYTNRNRTNVQYVTDLYNAFLRRGGDTGGVNFWVNQLNTGAEDRNLLRADFIASPEFGARVN
ncbi:MAG TPA: DUF4214 domain-containing protein, partial [Usitatibacter sp.]|nr:DUF4214 domain-containing protein [Usitatibacter sp.]